MNLHALQQKILAQRAQILEELEDEYRARTEAAKAELYAADAALRAMEEERRAQERIEINARKAARAAAAAARKAARGPTPTRKRAAGANWEIAGRPAHHAPGAPLRRLERKGAASVTRRHTRSMAKASRPQSR